MRWILYAALASSLAGGGAWVASRTQAVQSESQEEELEDFVPTEQVPADSSISFPVDI